jgi:hypothetical protein
MTSSKTILVPFALMLLATAACGGSTTDSNEPTSGDAGDSGVATQDAGRPDAHVVVDTGAPVEASAPEAGPSVLAVPLSGCNSDAYSAPVTIGSQPFQLLLDTGSSSLGVAASTCSNCNVSPEYTPGATATDEHAMGPEMFGSGSITGEIYQDRVAVGPSPSAPVNLIAIASQSGLLGNGEQCNSGGPEGLIGFGPTGAAVAGTTTFFDQFVATTHVPDIFAVELCDTSGTLWLGGFDPSHTTAAPQFTPMATGTVSSFYYEVNLASITVNGTSVPVPTGGQFPDSAVDTGTSVFILGTTAYNGLVAALNADAAFTQVFGTSFFAAAGSEQPNCVMSTQTKAALDAALPPLTLTFGSNPAVTVQAAPTESYLLPAGGGGWCAGVIGLDLTTLGAPASAIMGAAVLRSNVVIWDKEHSQIGFAPHTACP